LEEKEMLKLYALIIVLGILGGVGYGAMWYYQDTQARIATLRENNAKLEVAVDTANASMDLMKDEMAKNQELMNELSQKLQKAEQYGDDLRNKLRQLDLVQDAIKDAAKLEGKMNGATAKLWRSIVADTGGTPDPELAKMVLDWRNDNITYINFAIGGAFGNGDQIKRRADKIIALGKLTWPHQMVKMMIAEQIYRIETIIQGHPYHK
jgi:23S rRNA (pseudouridine1915-N3)-methyltransferase